MVIMVGIATILYGISFAHAAGHAAGESRGPRRSSLPS